MLAVLYELRPSSLPGTFSTKHWTDSLFLVLKLLISNERHTIQKVDQVTFKFLAFRTLRGHFPCFTLTFAHLAFAAARILAIPAAEM
jgi:hypothetical protein